MSNERREQLSSLESHLWEAANILRGPVDAADLKTYFFPPLSFKRITNVHNEEYRAALEESGGDEKYARFRRTTASKYRRGTEILTAYPVR